MQHNVTEVMSESELKVALKEIVAHAQGLAQCIEITLLVRLLT